VAVTMNGDCAIVRLLSGANVIVWWTVDGPAATAARPSLPCSMRAAVSTARKTTMTSGRRRMRPSLCGKLAFADVLAEI
jgi:hypothetical protein